MNVLIAGGSGFVGSALTRHLTARGHRVSLLSRIPSSPRAGAPVFHWDPERGELDADALAGVDAVVNFAGENLAGGRWTPERKRRLVSSRVVPTRFLVRRMSEWTPRPRAIVNASAVGIYGNRGEEVLTEASAPGAGFLADLCKEWESAALGAREHGIRAVVLRFGVVLGAGGGALAKMLPIFKLGLGGPLGSGKQWMSWIALSDVAGAIEHVLSREEAAGPMNAVAPAPVRNRDFARALGRVLSRPAVLPAPALALKLLLGEMADEALLSSCLVKPTKLRALGYRFVCENLVEALRSALKTRA